ncbi:MAG: galactose-1-phosphate uridylyltransferase [Candidatus Nanopelagicales bacterium]
MRRTSTRLSDGRELLYFDADGTPPRVAVDQRGLAAPVEGPQQRYDALMDEWVSVAAHRQDRTFQPSLVDCPLCPSGPDRLTEIPDTDYQVVVFENRFPSFGGLPGEYQAECPEESDLFRCEPAVGRCEVVCFTSDHDASFRSLTQEQARLVFDAWTDRTRDLYDRPGVEQVFVFENRGDEIGVTLSHPHGQIYAYPFATPRTRRHLESARTYRARTGRNLSEDLVAAELAAGTRLVAQNEHAVAFVPFAARWPVEVHLYPRRRVPDLGALTDEERAAVASLYLDVLRRCDRFYDRPLPYVAGWHQAPRHADGRDEAALHLELFSVRRAPDKLKFLAGSESAMDVFINDRSPEDVAARLRSLSDGAGSDGAGADG